jgi:hypothetical protein
VAFLTEAAIGPYQLTALLGQGGMSDVYRAVDTRTGAPVALKVVRSADAEMASRMALEVRALERFSHPALVRLLDSGVASGQAYMVMELVEGQTLSQRLSAGPLSPADTAQLGRRLASALAYVHRQGIVHRDVKPGNVLVSQAGDAYLADFGIARLLDASTMTVTGTTLGTAAYMAPEQLEDHQVGPAADIWSLGAVLFECLSGRRLFEGGPNEVLARRMTGRSPVPSGLPPAWTDLVGAMLDSRPAARPGGREVAEALSRPAFSGPWWPGRQHGAVAAGAVGASVAATTPPGAPAGPSGAVTAVDATYPLPGPGTAPTRRSTSRLPVGAAASWPAPLTGARAGVAAMRSKRAPAVAAVLLACALAGAILVAAWPAPPTRASAGGAAAFDQGRARASGSQHRPVPTTGRSQAKPGSTAPTTATTPTTAASSPSSTSGPSSSARTASQGAAAPVASSLHQPVASALSGLVGSVEAAVTRGKLGSGLGSALVSLAEAAVQASAHGGSAKAAGDLQQAQAVISQAAGSKLIKQGTAAGLSRAVSALGAALGVGSSAGTAGTAGGAPPGLGGPPGLSGGGPPGHDGGPGGHGDGGPQGGQGP